MHTPSVQLAEFALSLKNSVTQLLEEADRHDAANPKTGWDEYDQRMRAQSNAMRAEAAARQAKIKAADEGRGNLLIDPADLKWIMVNQDFINELAAAGRVEYTLPMVSPSTLQTS